MIKHPYYYIFVGGWIFFYWCSRRGSKLSSIFCGCFKLDFKTVSQYCFKDVFLNNFSFIDWTFRMSMSFCCEIHFFYRNVLNNYEKKISWMLGSWFAFCFHFVWLDAVGGWNQKKSSTWGMQISDLGNQM